MELYPRVKKAIENSSTILICNPDYAVQHFQGGFARPKDFYDSLRLSDFVFCQEPGQLRYMEFLFRHHMREKKKPVLVPHPVDTQLKKFKIDYDQRIDLVACQYHRYRDELLLPSMVSWGLKYPTVLFGLVRGSIPVGLFHLTAPMMEWSKYFYLLTHATLAFDYVGTYNCMGRFPMECLPPGQLVVTERGLVPIENVKIGDRVLTHKGRFRRVLKKFERDYNGELVEIKTYGFDRSLIVTPEHPVYVSTVTWKDTHHQRPGKEWREYSRIIDDPTWVPAKELKKAMPSRKSIKPRTFLFYPKFGLGKGRKTADLSYTITYENDPYKRKPRKVTIKVPLNEDFCKLIGYYLSEGSTDISKRRGHYVVELSFGNSSHERVLAKHALEHSERLGFGGVITHPKTATKVVIYSRGLAEFFRREFGYGAKNKKIPRWVLELPPLKLRSLLEAYIDGHITRTGRKVATTSSINLAYGIKQIGNLLGYRVSIGTRPPRESKIRGRTIVGSESYYIKFNEGRETRMIDTPSSTLLRIRWCRRIPYSGKVFNLYVDEDNSYCTFYHTVHNCACLATPTVCTNNIYMGQKLFPMVTHDPLDFEGLRASLNKLIENEEFYHQVADYAYEAVEEYNLDNSRKRLLSALEEAGLKVG